jgi:hypothetical protein
MSNKFMQLCGWIDNPEEVTRLQSKFKIESVQFYNKIAETGKGKTVLLHKLYEAVTGNSFPVWKQEIGDCVSFGYALAVNVLMAVQKSINPSEVIPADTATEPIYGGSRIEIGNQGKQYNPSESDGSTGIWAAEWVKQYGILLRKKYDQIDLSSYSGVKAKTWGWQGVPDSVEPIAKKHPVKQYALVSTYEEARDAIANGYPITVCSNQGFLEERDSEGFAKPYGTWGHCMCFVAADDAYKRPGLLCCNSGGRDWITGPKRHDQPDGSFWVDAKIVDKMLRERDSYALSSLEGFSSLNMMELMKKFNLI